MIKDSIYAIPSGMSTLFTENRTIAIKEITVIKNTNWDKFSINPLYYINNLINNVKTGVFIFVYASMSPKI